LLCSQFSAIFADFGKKMRFFRLKCCLNCGNKWIGLHFGQFFSQTHLVTLLRVADLPPPQKKKIYIYLPGACAELAAAAVAAVGVASLGTLSEFWRSRCVDAAHPSSATDAICIKIVSYV
jgi:hypothetical protein